MSKEIASSRIPGRSNCRNWRSEANENDFRNNPISIPLPPPRTPLNSIQDPSQIDESDSKFIPESGRFSSVFSEKKTEALDYRFSRFFSEKKAEALDYGSPRAVRVLSHSEPNSAQSTPVRSVSRVSNHGSSVACTSGRPPQCLGGRGGSLSKVSRTVSVGAASPWPAVEVPHFELLEDSSFWMDHNVQVIIRIRPISSTERNLQGYGRCLRQESAQTLTWLGHPETRFTFDHIACETISQEKLFKVAGLPMVENCMSGYNSCMFAYGQTGSGKTYTMMGEISETDDSLSGDCGMTPRIFEYLFTRISAEEENRRDERLKYSCKCSFLEIYNEQITDLLEPSSSNLQLREDMKKGVYVENLKEYEVNTVKDVVKLLLQGAANRKMAATYMNSESSRSHSVFTCVIESCWEKDSMTHFRFGRLNLVDLAGSERQKSSGAEGERLKEAANINKSLSTLGLVIMTLVDVAHGKHRHVPYRDSRLTFLLQDSLGGNSKTAIIANVSPSICSANETLSTLKFAQRAKLIQNNAKVNEDAAGDVLALQQQIHQLKEQLTFLLNHQNSLRFLSCQSPNFEDVNLGGDEEEQNFFLEGSIGIRNTSNCPNVPIKKMKNLEATLVGFLRREKKAEAVVKRLEAEIEHMNHLINRREEDGQRTKMLLRFREEKIRRLELLADGILSKDEYLKEENMALSEEIHLLQAKFDRHPELTLFALENIRLQEQIKMFQDFYEQGERETLLAEVSDLRDQLLEVLKDRHAKFFSRITSQAESKLDQATSSAVQERGSLHMEVDNTSKQLEECRKNLHACIESNVKLTSEVDDLRWQLENYSSSRTALHSVEDSLSSKNDPKMEANKLSSVVPKTGTTDSENRLAYCKVVRDKLLQIQKHHKDTIIFRPSDVQKELMDAKYLVEAMESQQIHLIEELDNLRHENKGYLKLLRSKCCDDVRRVIQHETHSELSESEMKEKELDNQDADQKIESGEVLGLKANLERMHSELVEARTLNRQYQDDQASQLLHDHELEQVREEIEGETVKTILCLQGDLAALQQEIESRHASESLAVRHSLLLRTENQVLQERLHIMSQENARLTSSIAERENELNALTEEWEKATFDLTSFLVEGCQSLEDASDHIESIVSLFSHRKFWIGEKVERAVKIFIEKEQTIIYLQKRLEEAQKMGTELQLKLNSLKGATLAISEAKQLEKEEKFKEVNQLKALLCERMSIIHDLERKLENKECEIIEAEKKANETLIVAKSLYEMNDVKSPHESVANSLTIEHATEIVQWNNSNLRKDSISESFFEVKCPMNDIDEEPRKLNVVSVVEQVKKGIQDMYADENTQALGEIGAQVEMARQRVLESEIAICASYVDTEKYLSALLSDILSTSSAVRKMVHDLNNDICAMKQKFKRLKDYSMKISCVALESPSCEVSESSKIEDQYSLLCFIRGEIAKTNKKLDALKASIDTHYPVEVGDPAIVGLNMLACSGCKTRWHQPRHEECYSGHGIEEAMDSKVSSIDGYTSDIDPSPIDMGPEENKDELLSSVFCDGCSGRLDKQIWDIFPNRDSALSSRDHNMLQTQRPVNDLVCNDAIALYLKEEVESALTSLMTIHGQLSKLLANNSMAMCADSREIDYCKSFGGRSDNCQLNCGHKEESNQLAMLEMGQMLQRTDQGKEKAEASCCKTREMLCLKLSDAWFAAEDKMKQANNLLLKFEEAQETMREADLMLNELLRVNESTKFKMNWWKQVGEVLMTEKASLMEEVQQLRASIQMKDEQYDSLEDQMLENVAEITALFSSLEVAFLRMQCNVEEEFKRIYSEIFSLRQELMDCIGNSRLCLESIWSQIMEKGFALFVLYQCHIGAVLEKFAYFNADSNFSQYRLSKSSSVHCNVGNICVDANGNNMGSKPMNGTEKVTQIKHSTCGVSVTGDSWDVLHEFKTVQHNHVGSHVDADFVNFDSQDLLSDKNCCAETVARSEETKLAPANGKKLIKEAIAEQLNYLEKFCQELISLHGVSDGEKSADNHFGNMNLEDGATVTSIAPYTCCSCVSKELQLQNPMIVSAIAENEVTEAKLGGVTVDRNTLFTGIQNLKTICTQMISLLDEEEDHPELPLQHKQGVRGSSDDGNLQCVQGRGIGLLDFPKMRTDCGHHAVEEMVKLVNKLFFVTGYIHSTMHVGTKNRYSASLLETLFQCICCMEEKAYCFLASMPESNFKENDVFLENLSLKRQLTRKEYILEGLLFDFRLLQESASNSKDIKDKSEKMMASLSKAQHELAIKTTQLDDILIRNKELEARLADRETALCSLKYELEQGREALNVLCNDNTEFRLLLEDLCIKKTDVEEQLEEKVRVVKDLEKEVLRLATSGGDRFLSSIQEVEDRFSRVTNERDQLQAEVTSLTDKLEMANALADENEAIAVEARQVSEASKIYAEQKEEEVKILECSVEELEYTINVLEKKVYEMGEEVERHRLMREDLELELQALGERVSTVENVPENLDGVPNIEQIMKDQMSRKIDDRLLELLEAKRFMKVLEKEKAAQAEEIKQCREYISELVLHAEAQASQYQQKYKTLETMVLEAKADTSISNPATSTLNRTDISSIRPRRSGSPFKCIASLVQQMNSEKDQELSAARRRMEELEALASTKQKEVCMLSARLLATENMTHDVIRDLLGVKLDMTNFANLIDQQQLQKFAEKAEHQKEESRAKEQEILMLRKQNNDFIEERESWIEENNQRQADILAAQVRVEQFQLRDQLLTAQNEMLKMDKTNLKKKIAELDEMVKGLFGSEDIQCVQQLTKIKENDVLRANYEHGWYHKTDGKAPYDDIDEACRL